MSKAHFKHFIVFYVSIFCRYKALYFVINCYMYDPCYSVIKQAVKPKNKINKNKDIIMSFCTLHIMLFTTLFMEFKATFSKLT